MLSPHLWQYADCGTTVLPDRSVRPDVGCCVRSQERASGGRRGVSGVNVGADGAPDLVDARPDCPCEARRFIVGRAARKQPVDELTLAQTAGIAVKPPRVIDRDIPGDIRRALTDVAEEDAPVADTRDKLRRLRFEPVDVPAAAGHDVRAPPAERSAPIGQEILRFVVD